MKIDRKRIYWIIISILLTAAGVFELYQLISMYINDAMATKTSTLSLDAKFLTENLGITICNQLRPNMTYLTEHNIPENIFNYATKFYYIGDVELTIKGDPNQLRLQLADILNDNITDFSLKRFFQMAAIKSSPPFTGGPLIAKDVKYMGAASCIQYAFDIQSDHNWRWLEQGTTHMTFREDFFYGDDNLRSAYLSIYNYDHVYHPAKSENFLPLLFRKNVDYYSLMNVEATKYKRISNCKPNPSRLIPPINGAKAICLEICEEMFSNSNCSRASAIFSEILKLTPLCDYRDRKMNKFSEKNHPFRRCVTDRRCNEAHYCTEWAFEMNYIGINGKEPKIISYRNDTDIAFGSHELWIYFLANSYLIEEVEIMTADTLLANIGGLLGLLCGFELTMAARYFYNHGCILFCLVFHRCFRIKNPRITAACVDRKFADIEVGSDNLSRTSRIHCETTVKEISEV